jgi:hypothetical protein
LGARGAAGRREPASGRGAALGLGGRLGGRGTAALVAAALASIAVGLGIAPSLARAAIVRLSHGRVLGVELQARAQVQPDTLGNMTYNGGPVLHTVRPYLVFWDPAEATQIPGSSRQVLERYLSDLASSMGTNVDTADVVRQYYDATGYADAAQTFDPAQQVITDATSYPGSDPQTCSSATVPAYPHCISDSQIQAELAGLIRSQALPVGLGAGAPAVGAQQAPVYLVITPPGVDVCYQAGDCASSTFCGYHSSFSNQLGDEIVYAVVPFLPVSVQPKQCQQDGLRAVQEPNGDLADMVVDNLSHELNESITDPLGDAWYVGTPYGTNEVADNCEMTGALDPLGAEPTDPDAYLPTLGGSGSPSGGLAYGTLYDQLIAGDHYYTQTVWSNSDAGCVPGPTSASLAATFTATMPTSTSPSSPILVGSLVRLDPSGSASSAGFSTTTWSFGDGTSGFSPGAPAAVTHIYSRPGSYKATLTLVDVHGNVATSAREINVYDQPIARFSVRRGRGKAKDRVVLNARTSTEPNAGAKIKRYSWSFGGRSHASGSRVSHKFKLGGLHRVKLTVTDTLGLSASVSRWIRVRTPLRPR